MSEYTFDSSLNLKQNKYEVIRNDLLEEPQSPSVFYPIHDIWGCLMQVFISYFYIRYNSVIDISRIEKVVHED